MQQTSKYQFNLVENTDDFSPAPLNQNMEKVEEELEGIEESLTEGLAEVMANLGSGGHNARIAYGSYVGTGTYGQSNPNTLTFGFRPVVVILTGSTEFYMDPPVLLRPMPTLPGPDGSMAINLTWGDTNLSWYAVNSANSQGNTNGATYYYVAIGSAE